MDEAWAELLHDMIKDDRAIAIMEEEEDEKEKNKNA